MTFLMNIKNPGKLNNCALLSRQVLTIEGGTIMTMP